MSIKTAQDFEDFLKELLGYLIIEADDELSVGLVGPLQETEIEYRELEGVKVKTYAEGSYLTRDNGLVVTFPDGNEFQITIVQR